MLTQDCETDPFLERCNSWCYDHVSWSSATNASIAHRIGTNASVHRPAVHRRCGLTGSHLLDALAAPSSSFVEDEEYCRSGTLSSTMCIGSRRWRPAQHRGHCALQPRGKAAACTVLARKNITEVTMIGDSLLRHVFLAMNLVMKEQLGYDVKPGCKASDAFIDGDCSNGVVRHVVQYPVTWCNGTVVGRFVDRRKYGEPTPGRRAYGPDGTAIAARDLPFASVRPNELVLHTVGVHPLLRNESTDFNNATMKKIYKFTYSYWAWRAKLDFPAQRHYWWTRPCKQRQRVLAKHNLSGRVIWIPPHFKVAVGRYDESNERSHNFSQESAHFFQNECGGIPTLDFEEPTRAAARLVCRPSRCDGPIGDYTAQKKCKLVVRDTCEDATHITHDGFHWGQAVNVLKAQLLLAYLAAEGT